MTEVAHLGARVKVASDDMAERIRVVTAAYYQFACRKTHSERRKGHDLPVLVLTFDTPRQATEFASWAAGWLPSKV